MRSRVFRMLWIANVFSSIGTWMQDVGAGWLMTSLAPTPVMVALVQTATTVPMFLLAIPAGALADLLDRRRVLIATQLWMASWALALGILTVSGAMDAYRLLLLVFLIGLGASVSMPAWVALMPDLVPRRDLPAAVALNSMAVNASRAIGPAAAGLLIGSLGTGTVFLFNAVSYLGIVGALLLWHPAAEQPALPVERFAAAVRTGLRYVRFSCQLRTIMLRGGLFFLFGSVLWALLPLVARQQVGGGPATFGLMVAMLGGGAVVGALLLPWARRNWSVSQLVLGGSLLFSAALVLLGQSRSVATALPTLFLAGVAWLAVLSSLFVSAQLSLPRWVRGRGLSVFMAVFMGSLAGGAFLWGHVADALGLPAALGAAAAGLAIAAAASARLRFDPSVSDDLEPSGHWPEPETEAPVRGEEGPVMVTVEYDIDPAQRDGFLRLLARLGATRRRDGAYFWSHFEDAARAGRIVEVFLVESWVEHLRQHARVTVNDRELQRELDVYLVDRPSRVRHWVHRRPEREDEGSWHDGSRRTDPAACPPPDTR